MKKIIPSLFFLFLCQSILTAASDSDVSISNEAFSPSAGQSLSVTFRIPEPGKIRAEILDLNRKVIRMLVSESVKAGFLKYEWDGKDANGAIVKDSCYFPRIRYESAGNTESATPESPLKQVEIKADYYDRLTGVLSYTLPQSSLVTVKAVTVKHNKVTGEIEREVKKIIAENAPRTAGKVVEYFDGFGDDGVYLPKSNYQITIEAQPLPPNTIIVYGGTGSKGGSL